MKDFGYCVWYIPENGPWYNFTNGFTPHVTVKHSMTYSDALKLYLEIEPKTIDIELDSIKVSVDEDFWALYYTIKPTNSKPQWYTENSHISFLYQYNEPINSLQINHLKKHLVPYKSKLTNVVLACCKGHFSKWEILQLK